MAAGCHFVGPDGFGVYKHDGATESDHISISPCGGHVDSWAWGSQIKPSGVVKRCEGKHLGPVGSLRCSPADWI